MKRKPKANKINVYCLQYFVGNVGTNCTQGGDKNN